ncbi:hypothetical protein GCM10022419_033470 [Nonomuraea rosea]|uniref:Transcriptional regulator WhiB n=1 Tax=Nonomuraea rosea TaxID=638574 RepID=A0ABP6WI96_9ACTN
MKRFAVATARHDAEWLLQHQAVSNDIEVRKQQRKAAQTRPRRRPATAVRLRLVTVARQSIADRLVAAGHQVGASEAEIQQVLDMVGLGDAGLSTAYTAKGERKRLVALCADCERPYIQLRSDGTFISHPRESHQRLDDDTRCPGSGQTAAVALRTLPPSPPTRQEPNRRPVRVAVRQPAPRTLPNRRPACQDEDRELFFPPSYGPAYDEQVVKARAVCGRCPLAAACLRYALDHGELTYGIWGGTTPNQRKALVREQAA